MVITTIFKFLSQEFLTWRQASRCLILISASVLTCAGLSVGCSGRQEAAADQVQHGSSTGSRQRGHSSEQTDRPEPVLSPAATQCLHMVWEHGRIRATSCCRLQAGQWDIGWKQSVSFSSSSSLSVLSSSFLRLIWLRLIFNAITEK